MVHLAERRAEDRTAGRVRASGQVDVVGILRKSFGESLRKRHARRTAASRGAGLPPDRIEEIVAEEWRRRGLEPPQGSVMETTVDLIAHPPGVVEQVLAHGAVVSDLAGLPWRIRGVVKEGFDRLLAQFDRERGRVFEIATGPGNVPVRVRPGSVPLLRRLAGQAVVLPSFMRATRAELRTGADTSVEVWSVTDDQQGVSELIGTVEGSDASLFGRLLATAEIVSQPCRCRATILAGRNGDWRMVLGRPLGP